MADLQGFTGDLRLVGRGGYGRIRRDSGGFGFAQRIGAAAQGRILDAFVRHFTEALDRLETLSQEHEPECAESLNPPATDAEIDAVRASLEP